MKKVIFLCSFFSYLCGEETPYQKFQTYMNINEGHLLNIQISQSRADQHFNSNGILYYFQNREYVFDSISERITYKDGEIETLNKAEKQIIYDSDIDNNLNIFDFFSGKDNHIRIRDSFIENDIQITNFFLDDWDIKGSIWTVPATGKPKKITLNLSVDETVSLNISSSKIVSKMEIPDIDISEYEIIDLRD